MIDWISFIFPYVTAVIDDWILLWNLLFLVVYGVLFGVYYEPSDDDDIIDVYVFPIGLTVGGGLLTPLLLGLFVILLPIFVVFALAATIAYGVMYGVKLYKEGKEE